MRYLLTLCSIVFITDHCAAQPTIGVVYGFTGPAAFWSAEGRKGLEMAAEELSVNLVYEDNETNPTKSATAFKKLVEQDKVDAVIGSVWDFITQPMIPLANRSNTLLISPTMMLPAQENAQAFYSLGAPHWLLDESIKLFFTSNPQIKRFGVICWDDGWGQGWRDAIFRVAKSQGVQIAAESCTMDFNSDLRAEVSKVLLSKPDGIFIPHLYQTALRRLKEQRYGGTLLVTGNIREDLHQKRLSAGEVNGIYFLDWPASTQFAGRFSQRYGYEPVVEAQRHYDALYAVVKALTAGRTVVQGIRTIKFTGASGEIDFSRGVAASISAAKLFRFGEGGSYSLVDN